jgi:hypothetical protein
LDVSAKPRGVPLQVLGYRLKMKGPGVARMADVKVGDEQEGEHRRDQQYTL